MPSPKKYRLKKDLPGCRAGTVYTLTTDAWYITDVPGDLSPFANISPRYVESHPDWFEEITYDAPLYPFNADDSDQEAFIVREDCTVAEYDDYGGAFFNVAPCRNVWRTKEHAQTVADGQKLYYKAKGEQFNEAAAAAPHFVYAIDWFASQTRYCVVSYARAGRGTVSGPVYYTQRAASAACALMNDLRPLSYQK